MDRLGLNSPAAQTSAIDLAEDQASTAPQASLLKFSSIDEARTHVATLNFPDQAQAYRYLQRQGEDTSMDSQSANLLKTAVEGKIPTLPKLAIRTEPDALRYVQQHYPTREQIEELNSSLVLNPHSYGSDGETARLLANQSMHLYNERPSRPSARGVPLGAQLQGVGAALQAAGGARRGPAASDDQIRANMRNDNGSLRTRPEVEDALRAHGLSASAMRIITQLRHAGV